MKHNVDPIEAPLAHDLSTFAASLSVSRRTLEREIEAGRLRSIKLARRTLILADEAKRYVASLVREGNAA